MPVASNRAARLDQVSEIVIGGGSGGARVHAIDGFEDLHRRWMTILLQQKCHYRKALGCATQPAVFKGALDGFGFHELFRLYLI
jgi:hypothetical protein